MSQSVKSRIRCALLPSQVSDPFRNVLDSNQPPRVHAGAGAAFELAFFEREDVLLDVSTIADLTLMVKPLNEPGVPPEILKAVSGAALRNITLEEWQAGTQAQATIALLGSETAIPPGQHQLTIWGHVNDGAIDTAVFGVSVLTVVDLGLTPVTQPPVAPQYATLEQVQAMLASAGPLVLAPGRTITLVSEDGSRKRILGVNNDGERQDDLEQ